LTYPGQADRPERRALIIDDEPAIRRLLTALLARVRWRTVAVCSGKEALNAYAAGSFHCVICDIDLGRGMDGLETVIRLLQFEPGLKVIFITGSAANAARAEATGMGAVMMKPFDPARLLALLDHGS
jgi:two-component system NtrC family response regulator